MVLFAKIFSMITILTQRCPGQRWVKLSAALGTTLSQVQFRIVRDSIYEVQRHQIFICWHLSLNKDKINKWYQLKKMIVKKFLGL